MADQDIIRAIKYYEGDVSGTDAFWSDPKAYVTLNSLLFPGIGNEIARAVEGKRLNPAVLEDTGRLTELYRLLLTAAERFRTGKEITVWRVERYSDYLACRQRGGTISFTSTSTAGYLGRYGDKLGLAVIEFHLPEGTPCIPLAEVLDVYAKADEAEVLLPPWLPLAFEERPLETEHFSVRDMNDEPPRVFAVAKAGAGVPSAGVHTAADRRHRHPGQEPGDDRDSLFREGPAAGMRIYRKLNQISTEYCGTVQPGEALAEKIPGQLPREDVCVFTEWKEALVRSLRGV